MKKFSRFAISLIFIFSILLICTCGGGGGGGGGGSGGGGGGGQDTVYVPPDLSPPVAEPADYQIDPDTGLNTLKSSFMVKFVNGATVKQVSNFLTNHNSQVVSGLGETGIAIIEYLGTASISTIVQEFQSDPLVDKVSKIPAVKDLALPPNPSATDPRWHWKGNIPLPLQSGGNWGQKYSAFTSFWNLISVIEDKILLGQSSPTIVGIIESGFDNNHTELTGILSIPSDLNADNVASEHGNHVAGIIGANYFDNYYINGASPYVDMVGAPFGNNGNVADVYYRVFYLQKNIPEIKAINISQAYTHTSCVCPDLSLQEKAGIELQGIFFEMVNVLAKSKGIIVVSGAGNTSNSPSCTSDSKYASPWNNASANAGNENIIVVAATGDAKSDATSVNVDSPGAKDYCTDGGDVVDIGAPGDGILSTVLNDNYDVMGGTSMAAPLVTAMIANLYAYDPSLTYEEVINLLINQPTGSYSDPLVPSHNVPVLNAFDIVRAIPGAEADLADVNEDEIVNSQDLSLVTAVIGNSAYAFSRYDINGDGKVDTFDQQIVSNNLIPECNDGIDNDGDTFIDYPNDPDCSNANDTTESPSINPPTNLSSSLFNTTIVKLIWSDNSADEDGFVIQRKESSESNFTQLASVNANITTYYDKLATPQKTYDYRVYAYNASLDSDYSNVTSITIPGGLMYQQDFSSDPLWTTNYSSRMYWDSAQLNYYSRILFSETQSWQYAHSPFRISTKDFRIEWDSLYTGGYNEAGFGLVQFDDSANLDDIAGIYYSNGNPICGTTNSLCFSFGSYSSCCPGSTASYGQWVHNLLKYNSANGKYSYKAILISTGTVIFQAEDYLWTNHSIVFADLCWLYTSSGSPNCPYIGLGADGYVFGQTTTTNSYLRIDNITVNYPAQ